MDRRLFSIFILGFLIFSCNESNTPTPVDVDQLESNQFSNEWRKLKCGLYTNSKGELAFSSRSYYVSKENEFQDENALCQNQFITKLNDNIPLVDIIDTITFTTIGSNFYKDKNSIYFHYAMCDGGYFNHFSDDTTRFRILNSNYVSHKDQIFYFRGGKLDADPNSFLYSTKYAQIAKDKDGYFEFGERKTEEEIQKSMGIMFANLKLKRYDQNTTTLKNK